MDEELKKRVEQSGLFDAAWYHRTYKITKESALSDYLENGWMQGRDAGPFFSTERYLSQYPDVKAAQMCPLLHFVQYGKAEGRLSFGSEKSGKERMRKAYSNLRKKTKTAPVCPVCEAKDIAFLPISDVFQHKREEYGVAGAGRPEMCNGKQYSCPHCGAADRDRLAADYILRMIPKEKEGALLHVAPSEPLRRFLKESYPHIRQTTTDLFMPDVDWVLDITNMPQVENGSFDYFICMHVLEHVSDDRAAIKELLRILKPDGWGILVVPIDLTATGIDEELGLSEEENWLRFGQGDHVRRYSHDGYVQRLEECGCRVQQAGRRFFGTKRFLQLGMQKSAILYVVKKA